jgi:riboflavin synthase
VFTGLVETTAKLRAVERRGPEAGLRFEVDLEALELGESVALDGVCLTVTKIHDDGFEADASSETLAVTTLGDRQVGDALNVERACKPDTRLGGHLVLGHVDGVGTVSRFEAVGGAWSLAIDCPEALQRYLASKGSICIDGVSLTINRLVAPRGVEIMLVPHTLEVTTLDGLKPGRRVNVEVDVLARYVGRQLEWAGLLPSTGEARDARLMDALQKGGFVK